VPFSSLFLPAKFILKNKLDASPPSHPPGKITLTQMKTISILRNPVIKNQFGGATVSGAVTLAIFKLQLDFNSPKIQFSFSPAPAGFCLSR
jgi:hypothetical protein